MITMMIPQTQAAGWKTYKDPDGRFSIDYPSDWESKSIFGMLSITSPGSNETVMVVTLPTEYGVDLSESSMKDILEGIANEDPKMAKMFKITKIGGKPAMDYTNPEGGQRVLYTFVKAGNVCNTLLFTFTVGEPDQFKSANKNYFDPMIKSIKLS